MLSLAFTVSLYFAFTRYEQNDLKSPQWLETTLFWRNGQIALALLMLGTAGLSCGVWCGARPARAVASGRDTACARARCAARRVATAGGSRARTRADAT